MPLDTTADVDEIEAVKDRDGNTRPAANADEQAVTNDRLSNNPSIFSEKVTPSTNGEKLPSHDVGHGSEVLVMADSANSGIIYVGESGNEQFPLPKGQGLSFTVTNTDAIAVRAQSSGDVVHVVGEN